MTGQSFKVVAFVAAIALLASCVVDTGDFTPDTPPDDTIVLSDSSEPWGYESLLYDVLMARDDTSFSGWVNNINSDVITFWALYYEDHRSLYSTQAVPAERQVRHFSDGGIPCGSDYFDRGNSLYCGSEGWVGIDLVDYQHMVDRFGPGVLLWVLSHEWGHAQQRYMTFDHTAMTQLERERQADCLAGAYVRAKLGAHISAGLSGHIVSGGGETEPPISTADLDGINEYLDWLTIEGVYGYDRRVEYAAGYNGGVQACLEPDYLGAAAQGLPETSDGQSPTGTTPDVVARVVELAGGFSPDPFTLPNVVAGGSVGFFDFGEGCLGYGPGDPHLELYWSGGGDFLRFYFVPDAENDATMVVLRPDGAPVCGDDSFETLNPTVDVVPADGVYVVAVGSYNEGDRFEGVLYITEIPDFHP